MRLRRWLLLWVFATGIGIVTSGSVRGQVNTVNLEGTALDPQGAAVPGTTVTVETLTTSASRTAVSDEQGQYVMVGLLPGAYRLTANARGFAWFVNEELVLTVGQSARFNIHLQLKAATTVVTVTETAELIENRRTSVREKAAILDEEPQVSTFSVVRFGIIGLEFAANLGDFTRECWRISKT